MAIKQFGKLSKNLKVLWSQLPVKFSLAFTFLLITPSVKKKLYFGWKALYLLSKKMYHKVNKINPRLKFLYCQNRFLKVPFHRNLCNSMIQPFLDLACDAWNPSIKKRKCAYKLPKIKHKFCLKWNDKSSIKSKNFKKINWLPILERVSQCSPCSVYNFFY